MRGRLADEDEMAAGVQDRLAKRLAGEQVVAEIDRIEGRVVWAVRGEAALGSPVLAVLLLRAVLRDDKFRFQRDDLVMSRRHQSRREHAAVIFRAAFASEPG